MSRIYKIKNFKIENFEIAKSFLGSLRVQRYIVFMSLRDYSASYRTSKKGLPRDLSKMPEAITRWPLLVELQYWLSRLQRARLPHRPSFRFFWNMRVLSVGRFVLECPCYWWTTAEEVVFNVLSTSFEELNPRFDTPVGKITFHRCCQQVFMDNPCDTFYVILRMELLLPAECRCFLQK